ncbi:MAG: hypothetical protein KQJ78_03280 [Deltaproteobacteria bacterium]|nr:hypothetical protein [Deltaproteobacteria bacterium]
MEDLILPAVREHLLEHQTPQSARIIIKEVVNNMILDPLAWFGLVETRDVGPFQIGAFRVTPLMTKFISFHF